VRTKQHQVKIAHRALSGEESDSVVSVVPDIAAEKKRGGCKRRKHANLMSLDFLATNTEIARVNKSARVAFKVASMVGNSDRGIMVSPVTGQRGGRWPPPLVLRSKKREGFGGALLRDSTKMPSSVPVPKTIPGRLHRRIDTPPTLAAKALHR
jgi:hypothetical protein